MICDGHRKTKKGRIGVFYAYEHKILVSGQTELKFCI